AVSAEGKAVTVYSSRHYDIDNRLFEAFTKQSGIRVVEVKGTSDELVRRLQEEGDRTTADLFIAVDGGVLEEAARQHVLQPVQSSDSDNQVPAKWRDPAGEWFGIAYPARVIVYAADRVDPSRLADYEDLDSEDWRGRLLVRSSSNIYNQ